MPRDAHSAAKAVAMLDLLIEFFDDGDRWIKGKLDDGAGNRCLVGALRDIRDAAPPQQQPQGLSLLGENPRPVGGVGPKWAETQCAPPMRRGWVGGFERGPPFQTPCEIWFASIRPPTRGNPRPAEGAGGPKLVARNCKSRNP